MYRTRTRSKDNEVELFEHVEKSGEGIENTNTERNEEDMDSIKSKHAPRLQFIIGLIRFEPITNTLSIRD